jgi:hypothetical protein
MGEIMGGLFEPPQISASLEPTLFRRKSKANINNNCFCMVKNPTPYTQKKIPKTIGDNVLIY